MTQRTSPPWHSIGWLVTGSLALAVLSAGSAVPAAATDPPDLMAARSQTSSDSSGEPEHHAATAEEEEAAAETGRQAEYRSLSTRYGVTAEMAAELLAFQEEALQLIERARGRYPQDFAGGWMVDKSSGGQLVLAFTRDADERAAEIAQSSSRAERITARTATQSEAQLRELRAKVRERFDELSRDVGLIGISIRPWSDRLVLQVLQRTDRAVQRLEDDFGADRILVEEASQPDPSGIPPSSLGCEVPYTSCNPLRGGIQLQGIGCSMGFNALRAGTFTRVVTTAGHCSNSGASHSDAFVGAHLDEQYGGRIDGAIHPVASGWATNYYIIGSSDAVAYQIEYVYTGRNLTNFDICMSGNTTGPFGDSLSCGPVIDPDWEGRDVAGVHFYKQFVFDRDIAPRDGDSGGPCFSNGRARGSFWGRAGRSTWCSYAINVEIDLQIDIRSKY